MSCPLPLSLPPATMRSSQTPAACSEVERAARSLLRKFHQDLPSQFLV